MNLLANWIARAAVATPDAVAWLRDGEIITYAQLAQRAVTMEPEAARRVVALADASPFNLALAACAASYRGVPFLPLNPALLAPRRAALWTQCGVEQHCPEEPGEPSVIELLIATSGSSGAPKAVMLSGANLAASVAASQHCLPVRARDVWLDCLPLYHVGGMMILYRCAFAGATVLFHEGFDAGRVWADIRDGRASHISLTPPMLFRLLDLAHGEPPPPALKYVLVGGGALAPQLASRARAGGWPLCVSYGMSETASQLATGCAVTEGAGSPLPGFEVDCDGTASQPGLIRVRGAAVMAGYANPGLIPGDGLRDGWFTTGDLGWFDGEGYLHVAGRHDDIVVSGACNIVPAEIEAILLDFPGVRDVAVTSVRDPVWGEKLVALLVGNMDLAELERWSRTALAGASRPRLWQQVESLPRNPLGKLQRNELREMAEELFKHEA